MVAFRDTLESLELPPDSLESERMQSEIGRRGALLATAGLQWQEHLGPLLTWQDAALLMASVNTRQGVNDMVHRGRLLALRAEGGHLVYPLFQFHAGRPLPALGDLLAAFREVGVDAWTVASWLVTPQDELDGVTPVEWLKGGREPDRAVAAARHAAARLER